MDNNVTRTPAQAKPDQTEILNFIIERIAAITSLNPSRIKTTTEFVSFGLDSADAAGLSGELAEWLNLDLEENLLWEHPTPTELAYYLSEMAS